MKSLFFILSGIVCLFIGCSKDEADNSAHFMKHYFNNAEQYYVVDVAAVGDDSWMILGHKRKNAIASSEDVDNTFLMKVNAEGTLLWIKVYPPISVLELNTAPKSLGKILSYPRRLLALPDGTFYILANKYFKQKVGYSRGDANAWQIVRVAADGAVINHASEIDATGRTSGFSDYTGADICLANNGGVIMVGYQETTAVLLMRSRALKMVANLDSAVSSTDWAADALDMPNNTTTFIDRIIPRATGYTVAVVTNALQGTYQPALGLVKITENGLPSNNMILIPSTELVLDVLDFKLNPTDSSYWLLHSTTTKRVLQSYDNDFPLLVPPAPLYLNENVPIATNHIKWMGNDCWLLGGDDLATANVGYIQHFTTTSLLPTGASWISSSKPDCHFNRVFSVAGSDDMVFIGNSNFATGNSVVTIVRTNKKLSAFLDDM